MKMKKISISLLALAGILSMASVYAEGKHSHNEGDAHQSTTKHHDSDMKGMDHHSDMKHDKHETHKDGMSQKTGDMFLVKKEVDGYTISFHVMEAKDGMQHGGSHNFMVKVEKGGVVQSNVVINSKVKHPNGQADSKKLMKMGDWYMTAYDLGHEGKHQLMVLFKTSDGEKHKAGVYYSG